VLRDDVSVRVPSTLWVLTSVEAFDLLYTDRGLAVDDVIELITRTAERAACEETGRRRRGTAPART
jgi:hypothetical protein